MNDWIEKFPGTRILVIGDVMLDHYIWGDVHRISPEAPVPVVNVKSDSYTAGGAANVALNLANLGIQSSVLSYYSNDEAGLRLYKILSDNGVRIYPNRQLSQAATIIKTRVLVRNQQLCRIDREDDREAYCINNTDDFYAFFDNVLAEVNAVIISDYAKGVVTQPLIDYVINAANSRDDLLVAVDPKPSSHLSIYGAGLLTPNRLEALQLAGFSEFSIQKNYELKEICDRIHAAYAPKLLVITLGADGMAICENGELIEILPTEGREVFDVSGAGDTVIATLTAALASGSNINEAARLANAAAGCVVAHMGTVPVNLLELKASINLH